MEGVCSFFRVGRGKRERTLSGGGGSSKTRGEVWAGGVGEEGGISPREGGKWQKEKTQKKKISACGGGGKLVKTFWSESWGGGGTGQGGGKKGSLAQKKFGCREGGKLGLQKKNRGEKKIFLRRGGKKIPHGIGLKPDKAGGVGSSFYSKEGGGGFVPTRRKGTDPSCKELEGEMKKKKDIHHYSSCTGRGRGAQLRQLGKWSTCKKIKKGKNISLIRQRGKKVLVFLQEDEGGIVANRQPDKGGKLARGKRGRLLLGKRKYQLPKKKEAFASR